MTAKLSILILQHKEKNVGNIDRLSHTISASIGVIKYLLTTDNYPITHYFLLYLILSLKFPKIEHHNTIFLKHKRNARGKLLKDIFNIYTKYMPHGHIQATRNQISGGSK